MSSHFPYFLYACPCADEPTLSKPFDEIPDSSSEARDEDLPLNPHSRRGNFSLYPLEHLLYCNECHEIRCPRCYFEEALYYYCPNCLFDVPNSVVKSETNSCFQCPLCVAPLALQGYQDPTEEKPQASEPTTSRDGPCILMCLYCSWSSLEIGIVFEKSSNLSGQLAKLQSDDGGLEASSDTIKPAEATSQDDQPFALTSSRSKPLDQYTQLATFYKSQITDTTPVGTFSFSNSLGLDSPSQLSRLLNTYGVGGLKKQRGRVPVMREALAESEGLRYESQDAEDDIIDNMQRLGWDGITSVEQRLRQQVIGSSRTSSRFTSDLRPVQTQLRSKRAKRCRTCRHNLVKLDEKRHRNKYHIRLIALNFLPTITAKPLEADTNLQILQPMRTVQFLLTFRNPMFDPVKVMLATPASTPGPVASRVTLLCPQFDLGANTDVWDEALDQINAERRKAREALEGIQPEAGKVWDKGRNWTTVIMEVVPGMLGQPRTPEMLEESVINGDQTSANTIEIPIFVRLEYETEDTATGASLGEETQSKSSNNKVKREIAYWSVVGLGKIAGPGRAGR